MVSDRILRCKSATVWFAKGSEGALLTVVDRLEFWRYFSCGELAFLRPLQGAIRGLQTTCGHIWGLVLRACTDDANTGASCVRAGLLSGEDSVEQ